MSVRDLQLECLTCHVPLMVENLLDVAALQCPQCDANWMSEADLVVLWRKAKPESTVTELMVHNDGSRRRPCPVCNQEMDIAWLDLIQFDRCERDGVWLDPGELDAVVAGIDGLDQIRADQERAKRAQAARVHGTVRPFPWKP